MCVLKMFTKLFINPYFCLKISFNNNTKIILYAILNFTSQHYNHPMKSLCTEPQSYLYVIYAHQSGMVSGKKNDCELVKSAEIIIYRPVCSSGFPLYEVCLTPATLDVGYLHTLLILLMRTYTSSSYNRLFILLPIVYLGINVCPTTLPQKSTEVFLLILYKH